MSSVGTSVTGSIVSTPYNSLRINRKVISSNDACVIIQNSNDRRMVQESTIQYTVDE